MKAWQLSRHGEPEEVLELTDVPRPVPGPGQLLVRVLAAAANFPDVLRAAAPTRSARRCRSPPASSCAARSSRPAPDVTRFTVGDRVIGGAALPPAAFAEYAAHGRGAGVPRARGTR